MRVISEYLIVDVIKTIYITRWNGIVKDTMVNTYLGMRTYLFY